MSPGRKRIKIPDLKGDPKGNKRMSIHISDRGADIHMGLTGNKADMGKMDGIIEKVTKGVKGVTVKTARSDKGPSLSMSRLSKDAWDLAFGRGKGKGKGKK